MPRTAREREGERERERRGGLNRQRSDTQESLQGGAISGAQARRRGSGRASCPCSRPDQCASRTDTATSSEGHAGTAAGGARARGNCTCRAWARRPATSGRAAPLQRPPPPTVDESNGLSKILTAGVKFWKVTGNAARIRFPSTRLCFSFLVDRLQLAAHLSPAWRAPTDFRFSPSPRSSSTNFRAGHAARACLLATASGQRCGTKLQFVLARGALTANALRICAAPQGRHRVSRRSERHSCPFPCGGISGLVPWGRAGGVLSNAAPLQQKRRRPEFHMFCSGWGRIAVRGARLSVRSVLSVREAARLLAPREARRLVSQHRLVINVDGHDADTV
jgi:hypothetical protein